MRFEEMLKKNSFRCHFKELESWCKEPNPEVVPVRTLGEWALKQYKKTVWANSEEVDKLENSDAQEAWYLNAIYEEIAIACLGKQEVERRLKSLRGRETK